MELVVAVVAQDGQCAVGVRDDALCLAAEPLAVGLRDRRGRGGLAPLELDRAEHVVVPVDLAPLALDELDDEVGARAPELVALHLQRAVVVRGELGGDVRRQDATRAGDRVEHRVRRGHVEHDGLGERDGAASQGDSQNLEAVAFGVVVLDERTDAGLVLVGDAFDGRDAERGGDRCDGEDERASDVKPVEPHLEHLDRGFDVEPRLRVGLKRGFPSAAASAADRHRTAPPREDRHHARCARPWRRCAPPPWGR